MNMIFLVNVIEMDLLKYDGLLQLDLFLRGFGVHSVHVVDLGEILLIGVQESFVLKLKMLTSRTFTHWIDFLRLFYFPCNDVLLSDLWSSKNFDLFCKETNKFS